MLMGDLQRDAKILRRIGPQSSAKYTIYSIEPSRTGPLRQILSGLEMMGSCSIRRDNSTQTLSLFRAKAKMPISPVPINPSVPGSGTGLGNLMNMLGKNV